MSNLEHNGPQTVRLKCLVLGEPPSNIFDIDIALTETVSTLKVLIKDVKKHAFDSVDANCLKLWNVHMLINDSLEHELKNFELDRKGSLLSSAELFKDDSSLPHKDYLHIVIQPTSCRLNCLVFGSDPSETFDIEISLTVTVNALKKVIQDERRPELAAIPANCLKLWNVAFPMDDSLEDALKTFQLDSKKPLSPAAKLLKVFSNFPHEEHLHIIVQPPPATRDGNVEEPAIKNLRRNNAALFKCLQVRVSRLKSWTMEDVLVNLQGGRLFDHEASRSSCQILAEIEARMAQRRTYCVPTGEESMEIRNARSYNAYFEDMFVASEASSAVVKNDREFGAFFNILRYYHADSNLIKANTSSSLKASNFTVYFILPPFFSCSSGYFQYKEQMPWGFPIFLTTQQMSQAWCKFRPNSDFMVTSISSLCPFIISEVISEKNESDRCRMLIQAIAIARAGQYLMKAGKQFFVVGIYLRANLIAERFVVVCTGSEEVYIAQQNFDLTRESEAVSFLREMYNLVTILEELEDNLDPEKNGCLKDISVAAKSVISLTQMAQAQQKKSKRTLASVPEDDGVSDGAEDDLGVFGADDIQAVLKAMKYKVDFILFGYPLIAIVSNVLDDSKKGFLKFVREGGKEIEILRYLTGINSPCNHTISGVRFWPVRGGHVISMPMAGTWLTELRNPDGQLWSVAKQLFEAVDFMHQRGVAHLDLKPPNILIPLNGGRLSIIDFNRSVRVKSVNDMFRGVVGTTGYLAPEVAAGRGLYSAIRADLWSCGKTLYELCNSCWPSADRDGLLEIARQLMDEDPEKRPMMSDILEKMAYCKVEADTRSDCLSFLYVGPPEVSA